jgi:hypothetical protein
MHEDPAEVFGILLDPVVLGRWMVLLEEPEDMLFQLT